MKKLILIVICSFFGYLHAAEYEQPPFEVKDPAISENFRQIYYQLGQISTGATSVSITSSSTSTLSNIPITQVTSLSYTAVSTETILIANNASAITINLPTAVGISGKAYIVKRISILNSVTLDPSGVETIDAAATYTLSAQYDAAMIVSDGSGWHVLADKKASTAFPSGAKVLFFQASCPAGWTQDTTIGGRVIRSTTSTGGGTGGTTDPASTITLAHSHTVNSHTHTGPSHTHAFTTASNGDHTHNVTPGGSSGGVANGASSHVTDTAGAHTHTGTTDAGGTGATGAASPGTDSQLSDLSLAYANVIVCTSP